jgi:hypothetical protein
MGVAMELPFGLDHILVACLALLLIGELRRAMWAALIRALQR